MARQYGMTLYSDYQDPDSHIIRLVLAEKAIDSVDIVWVEEGNFSEELLELNPYGTLPTLVDRELVLYPPIEIPVEYIEERFPHPPLLPVYPIARAKSRLMMFRIKQDWYSLFYKILQSENSEVQNKARQQLIDYFVMLSPVFEENPFFLSAEFSLVDCYIIPLLWRLPSIGIQLPLEAKGVINYAKRMFERPGFKASLSEIERELREGIAT